MPVEHNQTPYKPGSKRPFLSLGQASLSGLGQLKFMSEPRQFSDDLQFDIISPSLLASPTPPLAKSKGFGEKETTSPGGAHRQQAAGSRRQQLDLLLHLWGSSRRTRPTCHACPRSQFPQEHGQLRPQHSTRCETHVEPGVSEFRVSGQEAAGRTQSHRHHGVTPCIFGERRLSKGQAGRQWKLRQATFRASYRVPLSP